MTKIIHLRYAKRGASGTTALDGATRARLLGGIEQRISQAGGSEHPDGVYKTGATPQVVIETENFSEYLLGLQGNLDEQTLVLGYEADTGIRKLTCKFCTCTDLGESEFPAAEGSGTVPRYQITFDVHQGTGVTTLALAIVDTTDV